MPTEFERKYLVSGDAWQSEIKSSSEIAQGYIAISEHATVRVRISAGNAWITIKGKRRGTARSEFEYAIPPEDAADLLSSLASSSVVKTRHLLNRQPGQWTVDVFHGDAVGLVLLEIEQLADFEVDHLPGWAGLEVTDDDRFSNAYLSTHPYATWSTKSTADCHDAPGPNPI